MGVSTPPPASCHPPGDPGIRAPPAEQQPELGDRDSIRADGGDDTGQGDRQGDSRGQTGGAAPTLRARSGDPILGGAATERGERRVRGRGGGGQVWGGPGGAPVVGGQGSPSPLAASTPAAPPCTRESPDWSPSAPAVLPSAPPPAYTGLAGHKNDGGGSWPLQFRTVSLYCLPVPPTPLLLFLSLPQCLPVPSYCVPVALLPPSAPQVPFLLHLSAPTPFLLLPSAPQSHSTASQSPPVPIPAAPPLAGDEADVGGLPRGQDVPCLPPLLVRGVQDMEDIPKSEAERLAEEPAVLGLVVVEQRPAGRRGRQGTPPRPHVALSCVPPQCLPRRPLSPLTGRRSRAWGHCAGTHCPSPGCCSAAAPAGHGSWPRSGCTLRGQRGGGEGGVRGPSGTPRDRPPPRDPLPAHPRACTGR